MPEYQNRGFKKPFRKGGADRRDHDAPKQLYTAECSNCHAQCEVPFRPNGSKPVFCRNCFNRDRSGDDRGDTRTFRPKSFKPRDSFTPRSAPKEDRRIDDLKRQLTDMEAKIDRLTALLSDKKPVAAEKPAAAKKKAVTKKRAPKKA